MTFFSRKTAATATEAGILVGLIAVGLLGTLTATGTNISDLFDTAGGTLNSVTGGATVINDIEDRTLIEDGSIVGLSLPISDYDQSLNELVVTATAGNTTLLPAGALPLSYHAGTWYLDIYPAAGLSGDSTVTISAQGNTNTATETFTLTVTNELDAPIITLSPTEIAMAENVANSVAITISDEDTPLAAVSVLASPDNDAIFPEGSYTLTGAGSAYNLSFTPEIDGETFFLITASDGNSLATVELPVSVSFVDDTPIITDDLPDTLTEDGPQIVATFTVTDEDTIWENLTVAGTVTGTGYESTNGLIDNGDGTYTLTLTSQENASGEITVNVTANDGNTEANFSKTIPVTAVDDLPRITASGEPDAHFIEDGTDSINLIITDIDTAYEDLTITATSSNTSLLDSDNITITQVSESAYTATFTAKPAQAGFANITFTVDDGTTATTHMMTVVVDPIYRSCQDVQDRLSGATSGTYSIDEDGSGSGSAVSVYCDMETNGGGWARLSNYDASVSAASISGFSSGNKTITTNYNTRTLPAGWYTPTSWTSNSSSRRSVNLVTSSPVTWTTAYIQFAPAVYDTVDGFNNSHAGLSTANRSTVEVQYVDGISFTYGNAGSRKHLYTITSNTGAPSDSPNRSGFVGSNYYQGTGAYTHNFTVTKPAGKERIELRLMLDQGYTDEMLGFRKYIILVK